VGAPVEEARARPGVRWIWLHTDVPNAFNDVRAGRERLREYLRSLRQLDIEAVYSLSDPLPGLYEIGLLPYLAIKRGF
jgi:D-aspartate ligase